MLHFARPKAAHFEEEDINGVIEKSLSILQAKLKKGNISSRFLNGEKGCPGFGSMSTRSSRY